MAAQKDVGLFNIIVGGSKNKDPKRIQAKRIPDNGKDIDDGEINDDPNLSETINILIDMLRDNRLRRRKEFEFLGAKLFSVLFDNASKLKEALYEAIYQGPQMKLKYWRVELKFEANQLALASWPWEYLYCPEEYGLGGGFFLAERTNLVLIRSFPDYIGRRDLLVPQNELPLRVLFVAASPGELDPVEYESVLKELQDLAEMHKDKIRVTTLDDHYVSVDDFSTPSYNPKATFSSLIPAVDVIDPHVIHFVGHGRCDNELGYGYLAFMDEKVRGKARWVSDKELASKLTSGSLRLVFLQACESALPSNRYDVEPGLHHNPYKAISGVAMQLAQQHIPAVVAMQYRIQTSVANSFSRAFYTALAESKDVDAAMQAGRMQILTQLADWAKTSSFGLPVLYLQNTGPLLAVTGETTTAPGAGGYTESAVLAGANVNTSRRAETSTSSQGGTPPATEAPIKLPVIGTLLAGTPPVPGSSSPSGHLYSTTTPSNQTFICAWCARPATRDNFCVCGRPLRCVQCGTPVEIKRPSCGYCGHPLPYSQD